MPAIRTLPFGLKSSLPYDTNLFTPRSDKVPFVRIHTPTHDLSGPGFDSYEDSLSQWIHVGPLYSSSDFQESAVCPPSYTPSPHLSDKSPYEEPLEGNLFTWPYEAQGHNFESSYNVVPELPALSNFSPSTSLASFSPRSDHSGLSLSPQPPDFSNHPLSFDYSTSLPNEFPSMLPQSMASLSHSPKSSMSHSPSPSCSSLDAIDTTNKRSKSRDASPTRTPENDARRRFPCLIIGCERRFTSQYTLKVHMEAHKPKPRVSFPCTLGCNERFSRQHDRLRHEVAKHGKVCEFSCEECGRFFSTKKTLGNHKCPVAQGGTRWVTS